MDFGKISSKFEKHFPKRDINIEKDELEYESGSASLKISKNGVEGEMPLHSFKSDSFKEIIFSEKEVKIVTDEVDYIFRK